MRFELSDRFRPQSFDSIGQVVSVLERALGAFVDDGLRFDWPEAFEGLEGGLIRVVDLDRCGEGSRHRDDQ
ncbi:MAG TPA: hypothetical protein VHB99_01070, partial [Pirellulales bacterium]|nr:hypothetical protein [Pirellulales bacterium]